MSFLALLSAVTTVVLFLAREEAVEIIAAFIGRFRK